MPSITDAGDSGFSLIETLVASALVASVVVGLAHLVAVGAHQSLRSRRAVNAVAAAQSKLEQLRNQTWRYDHTGMPTSSPALNVSPSNALSADTPGYVDFVDAYGEPMPLDGSDLPDLARRWSIAPFEAADPDTLIVHICAYTVRTRTARDPVPVACASTIRTRKP